MSRGAGFSIFKCFSYNHKIIFRKNCLTTICYYESAMKGTRVNVGAIKNMSLEEIHKLPQATIYFTRNEESNSNVFYYAEMLIGNKLPIKFHFSKSEMFNLAAYLKLQRFEKKFCCKLFYQATKGITRNGKSEFYLIKLFINPETRSYVRTFINDIGYQNWIKAVPAVDDMFEVAN